MAETQGERRSQYRKLVIVFLVTAMCIIGIGSLYYSWQRGNVIERAQDTIEAVSDLKVAQIQRWRDGRLRDARILGSNPFASAALEEILSGRGADRTRARFERLLTEICEGTEYREAYLLDLSGRILVASSGAMEVIGEDALGIALDAMRESAPVLGDFHMGILPAMHFDVIAPIASDTGKGASGAFFLRIDPDVYLFPMIQNWPTPSTTAETLLVRREGGDVLHLNELRHRSGTAMVTRFPVSTPDLPAAMGARGVRGIVEGRDYRGESVLAIIAGIPGTEWVLVSKIDMREILEPLKLRFAMMMVLMVFSIGVSGYLILWIWRARSAEFAVREEAQRLERSALVEHYDYLSRYANDIILVVDSDLRIVECNDRATESYGYARERLLGMSVLALRLTGKRDEVKGILRRAEAKKALLYEAEHVRADDTVFPVEVSLRVIEIEGRRYYQAIVRDITERKKAEEALRESEQRYGQLAEQGRIVAWEVDTQGLYTFVSNVSEAVWGYRPDELTGRMHFYELHPESGREEFKTAAFAIFGRKGLFRNLENPIQTKDGAQIWVSTSGIPVLDADGTLLGYRGSDIDITERKMAKDEIKKLNAELEQRVEQRTAELAQANKEMEAFSYSVAHDLRAPLRAIGGFTKILMEDYADRLDDEGKRTLGVVVSNTARMDELIDDLLALSRIGRKGMSFNDLDMGSTAKGAFEGLCVLWPERRIEFKMQDLPRARGDSELMGHVWTNLLSNAIKFTRPREGARIEIGGRVEGDEAIYFVKDNGVGFDMKYADKLFGVFQRLHAREEFEGAGVGLAIVQRVVHRHGGRVWAEGKVGEGATFYFSLPQ